MKVQGSIYNEINAYMVTFYPLPMLEKNLQAVNSFRIKQVKDNNIISNCNDKICVMTYKLQWNCLHTIKNIN